MRSDKSRQFERAEAMVYADKFNMRKTEFFAELSKLVGSYMDYDGLTVTFERGVNSNLILTVSVKKVKPTFHA